MVPRNRPTVSIALTLLAWGAAFGFASRPTTQPATTRASGEVSVRRSPPTVRRVMFDPSKPHDNIPSTRPSEAAIAQYRFDSRVKFEVESVNQSDIGGSAVRIHVDLALENAIYLPFNATLALRTHEEGHRELIERLYDTRVDAIARDAVHKTIGEEVPGNEAEAAKASEKIKKAIDAAIAEQFDQASRRYDRITDHGRHPANGLIAIDETLSGVSGDEPSR